MSESEKRAFVEGYSKGSKAQLRSLRHVLTAEQYEGFKSTTESVLKNMRKQAGMKETKEIDTAILNLKDWNKGR